MARLAAARSIVGAVVKLDAAHPGNGMDIAGVNRAYQHARLALENMAILHKSRLMGKGRRVVVETGQ